MDPELLKSVSDFVPNTTKEQLFNPTANAIGRGVGGIFAWIFQKPIKYGIIKEKEFADLANKTSDELKKIPEENKDDSKKGLSIKTLESAKYSMDNEQLRRWFAKLLSSTVDNRVNRTVSPLFPTVLSNMSPTDAKFLYLLKSKNTIPVLILAANVKNNPGQSVPLTHEIVDESYPGNTHRYSDFGSQIDFLSSFGIIESSTSSLGNTSLVSAAAKASYNSIKSTNLFKYAESKYAPEGYNITVVEGYAKLTSLGESFIDVAMPK